MRKPQSRQQKPSFRLTAQIDPQLDENIAKRVEYVQNAGVEENIGQTFEQMRSQGIPSAKSTQIWVSDGWKRFQNASHSQRSQHDYGIVVLNSPLGKKTGYFGMSSKGHSSLNNQGIYLLGRGGDKQKRTLWRSPGKIGRITPVFIYHDADMVKGNSGGPIMLTRNPRTIIALNNFEYDYSGGRERSPNGTFPNGGLLLTDKIIRDVQQFLK